MLVRPFEGVALDRLYSLVSGLAEVGAALATYHMELQHFPEYEASLYATCELLSSVRPVD